MQSYPFTSRVTYDDQGLPLYDRAVDSAFLRQVFAQYFSDGIFYAPTTAMQVVAASGMAVQVNPGSCHIRGAIGIEPAARTLVVQASEALDRIDTVVARLDLSTDVRSIDLYVVMGTAAETPTPPPLTRDATRWELGLANLFVARNTSTITQQRITDTRLDTSRCGLVAQTIGALDTSVYFDQVQATIDEIQQLLSDLMDGSAYMLTQQYDHDHVVSDAGGIVSYVAAALAPIQVTVSNIDSRLRTLELKYDTNVTGNAFEIGFADLDGLEVTGNWNETYARIEF